MHKVKVNKRAKSLLRFIAYGVTLSLTVMTTVLLLFVAQGYRFDRSSGKVVHNGLLLVDNKPEAGMVYIDGKLKDAATPSRFVIPSRSYELSLERDGYFGWKKQIEIIPSGVAEHRYMRLIPKNFKFNKIAELTFDETRIWQSPNRKLVLAQNKNGQIFLIKLAAKQPQIDEIQLPESIKLENGLAGNLSVIEWGSDNKHLLLNQILPSGEVHLLSWDLTKPEVAVDITAQANAYAPSDIHYVGGDIKKIYGLHNGILGRYNLEAGTRDMLLENVRNYVPYGEDTILFSRLNSTKSLIEVGILKDGEVTTLHEFPAKDGVSELMALGEFDTNNYFAVGRTDQPTVTIYRNPLQKPILKKQLPFAYLKTAFNPTKLNFSDTSQFLLAQNGRDLASYDFEYKKSYNFTIPSDLAAEATIKWIDNHHVYAQLADGTGYYVEYDGSNGHALAKSAQRAYALLSDDYESIYQFTPVGDKLHISVASMIANK